MALPKANRRQRSFTGGQINPDAERRSDLDIFDAGLKTARNVRALDTGALTRRPPRRAVYFDGGYHGLVRPISTTVFDVTFAEERFTARLVGGGIVSNITGCPWTAAILPTISWEPVGRRIFVTAHGMQPRYLEYSTETGVWTLNTYEFRTGVSGRVLAPFHRFADFGVTLTPSALTGSITLTASADVFDAGHVGVLFTYVDRQVRITGVTDAQHATATVIEPLPPTYRLTLDSVNGFSVGETVEGEDSNTVGEIVQVDTGSNYIYVVVSNNFSGFDVTGTEYVIADNGRGKISAQDSASPGASLQWKEQFMSDYRSWPGSVSFGLQRLCFCDFPQFENAIIWSAVDAADDLDASTGEDDGAIFTYVPKTCRVLQVISGVEQFVLTDAGAFYVPISEAAPLTPANARFRPISTVAAGNVRAVLADDAVIFVGADLNRLFALYPTGDASQAYRVISLTDFHSDLFSNPVSIAVADGSTSAPGRHLYVVNDDGTVVVGRYRQGDEYVGWFPWDGTGEVTAVAAGFGTVIFSVSYPSADVVEALDEGSGVPLDGAVALSDFVGSDAIALSTGEAIGTSEEEELVTQSGALIPFAGVTAHGWADGFYLGEIAIDAEGRVDFPSGYTDRYVGWLYEPEIEPFIPTFEGGQDYGQGTKRRKVARVIITVRDTQTFVADGHEFGHQFASYNIGEDMGQPRPLRDETYRYRQIGRGFDPRVSIRQPIPGRLTILEIATEVTI